MSEIDDTMLEKVGKLGKILEWSVTGAPGYENLIRAYEEYYREIRKFLMKYPEAIIKWQ